MSKKAPQQVFMYLWELSVPGLRNGSYFISITIETYTCSSASTHAISFPIKINIPINICKLHGNKIVLKNLQF